MPHLSDYKNSRYNRNMRLVTKLAKEKAVNEPQKIIMQRADPRKMFYEVVLFV